MNQYFYLSEKFKADGHKIELEESKTLVFSFIILYILLYYIIFIFYNENHICFASTVESVIYKDNLNFIFKIFQLM